MTNDSTEFTPPEVQMLIAWRANVATAIATRQAEITSLEGAEKDLGAQFLSTNALLTAMLVRRQLLGVRDPASFVTLGIDELCAAVRSAEISHRSIVLRLKQARDDIGSLAEAAEQIEIMISGSQSTPVPTAAPIEEEEATPWPALIPHPAAA